MVYVAAALSNTRILLATCMHASIKLHGLTIKEDKWNLLAFIDCIQIFL